MKFTVLGSNGFIGSSLVYYLREKGMDCFTPDIRQQDITNEPLGHVIYAIGVPNFMQRPFDAVNAHACALLKILRDAKFDSFLYLSSARIYNNSSTREDDNIVVNPGKINDLYNISKVMGESLCLSSGRENVRIVRPSNVTGNNFASDLFIPSILRNAVDDGKILLHSSLKSEKDYVFIDDLVQIIPDISLKGKHKIYNVAYGKNLTSQEIISEISRITGCKIDVEPDAREYSFPVISNERIVNEFEFKPSSIIPKLENMIHSYKKSKSNTKN